MPDAVGRLALGELECSTETGVRPITDVSQSTGERPCLCKDTAAVGRVNMFTPAKSCTALSLSCELHC